VRPVLLLVALCAGVLAAPPRLEAQQPRKVPQVGIVWINPPAYVAVAALNEAFRQALRELGYVEGETSPSRPGTQRARWSGSRP